jgi:hypothetical protein
MNLTKYVMKVIKINFYFFVLIGASLAFIPISFSAIEESKKTITVGSYFIPGIINEDATGMFTELNKAIFKEMNKNSNLTLSSINRARKRITTVR